MLFSCKRSNRLLSVGNSLKVARDPSCHIKGKPIEGTLAGALLGRRVGLLCLLLTHSGDREFLHTDRRVSVERIAGLSV